MMHLVQDSRIFIRITAHDINKRSEYSFLLHVFLQNTEFPGLGLPELEPETSSLSEKHKTFLGFLEFVKSLHI